MYAKMKMMSLPEVAAGLISAALGTIVFAFLAHQVSEGKTQAIDSAVYSYFRRNHTPTLDVLMTGLSLLANGYMLALIAAVCVLLTWQKLPVWPNTVSVLFAIGGGEILLNVLKIHFHRPRPSPVFAHLGYSFPSGHAFLAVSIYGLLTYWLLQEKHSSFFWLLTAAMVSLIGFSRFYLGEHYLSDVAAGAAAGVAWGSVCLMLRSFLFHVQNHVLEGRQLL